MDVIIGLGNELKLLKTVDAVNLNSINFSIPLSEDARFQLRNVVKEKEDDFILLFLRLLNNIHREDAVIFLLPYLQALTEDAHFTASFANIGFKHEGVDPIAPFLQLLNKQNVPLLERGYACLGALLSASSFELQQKPVGMLLDACLAHARRDDPKLLEVGVHTLSFLLRNPDIRVLFHGKGGVPVLLQLLIAHPTNVQLVYEVGFCVWMLTFNDQAIITMMKANVIPLLHDILRNNKKEKCQRVALLSLKNLARLQTRQHGWGRTEEDDFLPDAPTVDADDHKLNIFGDMISVGLLRTLNLFARRAFGDPDILPEVESLLALLEKNIEDTTSFADYKQEVLSRRLDWTPVHKSEKFWKENLKEFEKDDYKILRELCSLLDATENTKALTIICHDLGEFVKYHPQGRKILNALNVKGKILGLMGHEDPDVNKQALMCTQKIMVQKWEFLGA
eukprot:TRINITY_DN3776_c0_g1_i1.p1 TRINITY_DN3776_c0_g1~~TRINITY_DN3776_c0_g1_i1.p1  ORF type:complete len:451 (-),score=113.23 TRINITY_DN3776_c0_g1_i1:26-1378(-)